jgi:hypothetical protein
MDPKEIQAELNQMLVSEKLSKRRFEKLTENLAEEYNIRPLLIDFTYYSEKHLKYLHSRKIKKVKEQDFENAAIYRSLEKECQSYIDLKKEYNIDVTSFVLDDDFITLLYLGMNNSERKILRWYKAFIAKYPYDEWTHKANGRQVI